MGFATVAAFDSGNLVSVAKTLHAKYPEKQIIIAADDDKHLELTHGINPGRTKAEDAARAVGGKVLLPIFAPNENSYPPGLETVHTGEIPQGQIIRQATRGARENEAVHRL
jgi:putative DNA primase/helicase